MLFLTKRFGVTSSDAERDLTAEGGLHPGDRRKSSADAGERCDQAAMSARAWNAREGHLRSRRSSRCSTCAMGLMLRLGETLARGIFAEPGSYPATVRFARIGPAGQLRLQGRCPLAVNFRRPYPRWNGRAIGRRSTAGFLAAKRDDTASE